jgi:hypothetical protein
MATVYQNEHPRPERPQDRDNEEVYAVDQFNNTRTRPNAWANESESVAHKADVVQA